MKSLLIECARGKLMGNASNLTSLTSDQNLNCLLEKPLYCNYFLKAFVIIRIAEELLLNDIQGMEVIIPACRYLA